MRPEPLSRDGFPVTSRWAYLNHAAVTPLPAATVAAVSSCAASLAEHGVLAWDEGLEERVEEVRRLGAAFMGVPAEDVAFVKNTTEGLGFVASGLSWSEGDKVVVPACEFPSNLSPWLALADRGVEVVTVPGDRLEPAAFEEALEAGGVKVVALSWVQYGRGWRADLAALGRLCRDAGALLCVDAIQGVGLLPAAFEEWGVDFAAADGHKWMLGAEGQGFFYARAEHRERLAVLEPGWNAVAHRGDYDDLRWEPDPSARRFEGGSHNGVAIVGLGASLDLLAEATVEAVWDHVDALCARLVEGLGRLGADVLTERDGGGASGIVTFAVPGLDATLVRDRLRERDFVTAARGGGVRVSPHGYNSEAEVDALLEALDEVGQHG